MSIDNTYRKYTKRSNQTSIIHLCRRSNKKLISHHNDFFLDIKKQYTYIKYMYQVQSNYIEKKLLLSKTFRKGGITFLKKNIIPYKDKF